MFRTEIGIDHELYPKQLLDLEKPPKVLYCQGNTNLLAKSSISIIGSRLSTPYGVATAQVAGRIAVECDLVVVSGGAMGCDYAASKSALTHGGETIVVSGCGADQVYPEQSRDLFEAAEGEHTLIVSLEEWGTKPRRFAFPKRNKIIAALSKALIITEAGRKSGTMSTALCASELGRGLFAVPGSIFSPTSVGTNELISNGAAIICSEYDLETLIAITYDKLRLSSSKSITDPGRILSALIASPMRADDLADRLQMPILELLASLADYQAHHLIVRLADGRFSPTAEFLRAKNYAGKSAS